MSAPLPPIPLYDLAAIGPFFTLEGPGAADGDWQPACALLDDADELGRVMEEVAGRLGSPQRWIAASVFYQGWSARLTAIYTGSAALCGAVPDLCASVVRYRPGWSGPVPLRVEPLRSMTTQAGWRHMLDNHLEPLAAAVRRQVRIGAHLLRGNAASAIAGALTVLAQKRQERLESLISRSWAQPADFAGYGRWLQTPDGSRYARTTCCGYEVLGQGGRCADCSLNWLRPPR
jgi:hypothetical protein